MQTQTPPALPVGWPVRGWRVGAVFLPYLEDAGGCGSLLSISMSWRLFACPQETRTKSIAGDLQPRSINPGEMWCAASSLRRCPSEIVVVLLPTARGKGVPESKDPQSERAAELLVDWLVATPAQPFLGGSL